MNVVHPLADAAAASGGQRVRPLRGTQLTTPLDRSWLLAHNVIGFEDTDPRTRPFTMLRSKVLNRSVKDHRQVIAVTSTHPGDGKTTIAANLAAAASRIYPTVLIDLDLRRPEIGERFGIVIDRGVDDYLDGALTLDWTSYAIGDAQLTIVPVRQPRLGSAQMLASERLGQLFATVRARSDHPLCLVDTPPVLAMDDIMVIARAVDGVLLVVNEGRTRREELREAMRLLHPTPVIGTVLNRSLTGSSGRSADAYYRSVAVPDKSVDG